MKYLNVIGLVLSVFLFSGCAVQTAAPQIDPTKTFTSSIDPVWAGIMDYLTLNNIQIKTIEKESGVIYAERIGSVPKEWVQCQLPFLATGAQVDTAQFNILVTSSEPNQTNVRVNLNSVGTAYTLGSVPGTRVSCDSTGEMERLIFTHIESKL